MTKLDDFLALRELGIVTVHVDASRPFVLVPPAQADDRALELNFGYRLGKLDLQADEWGIRETLCFKGVWLPVALPWAAVWSMAAQRPGERPVVRTYLESLPENVHVIVREVSSPGPRSVPMREAMD